MTREELIEEARTYLAEEEQPDESLIKRLVDALEVTIEECEDARQEVATQQLRADDLVEKVAEWEHIANALEEERDEALAVIREAQADGSLPEQMYRTTKSQGGSIARSFRAIGVGEASWTAKGSPKPTTTIVTAEEPTLSRITDKEQSNDQS